jgi:hypothetical protein
MRQMWRPWRRRKGGSGDRSGKAGACPESIQFRREITDVWRAVQALVCDLEREFVRLSGDGQGGEARGVLRHALERSGSTPFSAELAGLFVECERRAALARTAGSFDIKELRRALDVAQNRTQRRMLELSETLEELRSVQLVLRDLSAMTSGRGDSWARAIALQAARSGSLGRATLDCAVAQRSEEARAQARRERGRGREKKWAEEVFFSGVLFEGERSGELEEAGLAELAADETVRGVAEGKGATANTASVFPGLAYRSKSVLWVVETLRAAANDVRRETVDDVREELSKIISSRRGRVLTVAQRALLRSGLSLFLREGAGGKGVVTASSPAPAYELWRRVAASLMPARKPTARGRR